MSDSRQHDRKDFLAHIEFRSGAGIRNDRISDLSLGGCYIDSIVSVSVGDKIDFDLIHPNGGRLTFQGEVTHHTTLPELVLDLALSKWKMIRGCLLRGFCVKIQNPSNWGHPESHRRLSQNLVTRDFCHMAVFFIWQSSLGGFGR